MTVELIAIIFTGVISTFDLFVNLFQSCMSGHCRSSCGCFKFEHKEDGSIQSSIPEFIRRTVTPTPRKHQEQK